MQQALIIVAGWLTSMTIAYGVYCFKGNNKGEKIQIMSVRSELRKIDKLNKATKDSMF